MRAIWSGSISFGLINIPVNLYSAAASVGIDFDMLHKKDDGPIKYARICTLDGKEVPYDEIVKGYEWEKGDYIVLSKDDFERASAKKTETIDIVSFTNEAEINPIYFEKPYYLEPKKGADKAYALLREALKQTKKVGIATFVLRNREHLSVLKAEENGLLLVQLRFATEIRDPDEVRFPLLKVSDKEVKMARSIIDELTEPFQPERFRDTYTEELRKVIEAKAKGKKPPKKKAEAVKPTPSADLMKLLMKSLEESRKHDTRKVRA